MTELVAAVGIGVVRAGRPVLDDVSITAPAGEITALTGPSGSGKSTLIAALAGLTAVTTGSVEWDGVVIGPRSRDLRHRCGLVLQGYGLVSLLSAVENVELVLQTQKVPRDEVRERAREAMALVGMDAAGDHLVEQLSGGQQQRVAVARAVVGRPEVLLADEPTAELDSVSRDRVLSVLMAAADRGAVVVLATHDPQVAELADSEFVLEDGRVLEQR
jgi:ABC-type lipoprotein export system ATPase subunit